MPGRILVVEDHAETRQMLHRLLQELEPRPEMVAEAGAGEEAVTLAALMRPDVVVMDIVLPNNMTGVEAGHRIRDMFPGTRIILMTGYGESWIRAQGLEPGIFAFLMKGVKLATIFDTVRRALAAPRQEPAIPTLELSPQTAVGRVLDGGASRPLTEAEQRVAERVQRGESNPEIAEHLNIGRETVKTHLEHIREKLGVRKRLELILRLGGPTK